MMHIFRWPVISLLLALVLLFFIIGSRIYSTPAQKGIAALISELCDTYSSIESVTLSPMNASLTAHDIYVSDPLRKDLTAIRAGKVTLRSEPDAFLNERVVIKELVGDTVHVRLYQTPRGYFTPFPLLSAQHFTSVLDIRAQQVLTYAADYANPFSRVKHIDDVISTTPQLPDAPSTAQDDTSSTLHSRLHLPAGKPHFVLESLFFTNVSASLIPLPAQKTPPVPFHDGIIAAENISSDPLQYPLPLRWVAKGWLGPGKSTFCAVAATLDMHPAGTNISVSFVISNAVLSTFLPYVSPYLEWSDVLSLSAGTLTAQGTLRLTNNIVVPGSVYCRLDNLTASLKNTGTAPKWLKNLSFKESSFEANLPLDNTPPYLHAEKLMDTRTFRGKLRNFEIHLDPRELGIDMRNSIE